MGWRKRIVCARAPLTERVDPVLCGTPAVASSVCTTCRGSLAGSTRPGSRGSRDSVLRLGSAAICRDRKSTRLNSSHSQISYAVFCLKKKKNKKQHSCTDQDIACTRCQHMSHTR